MGQNKHPRNHSFIFVPPLNRHNTKKNYHNKIRLSQRNPCKIKVFLGCSYYTAISLKNINQLRKFINACCSQYLSNWSNSGVILSRIRTATLLLCPYQHRTKFINFKQLSLPSSDTSARSLSPSAAPYHCPHWPLP